MNPSTAENVYHLNPCDECGKGPVKTGGLCNACDQKKRRKKLKEEGLAPHSLSLPIGKGRADLYSDLVEVSGQNDRSVNKQAMWFLERAVGLFQMGGEWIMNVEAIRKMMDDLVWQEKYIERLESFCNIWAEGYKKLKVDNLIDRAMKG